MDATLYYWRALRTAFAHQHFTKTGLLQQEQVKLHLMSQAPALAWSLSGLWRCQEHSSEKAVVTHWFNIYSQSFWVQCHSKAGTYLTTFKQPKIPQ